MRLLEWTKDKFFSKSENAKPTQTLPKSSENIEMKNDINQLINDLDKTLKCIESKPNKDNHLGQDLAYELKNVKEALECGKSSINSECETKINELNERIVALCSLRGKNTKLANKRREEVSDLSQIINDLLYNLGLNQDKIKQESENVETEIEPNATLKVKPQSKRNDESDKKDVDKTRDDDTNGWNVLMKGLVSRLDVMSKDIFDLISKSRRDLYNKIATVESSVSTFSNKVEKKLDLNVKAVVDGTTAITSELDKVSKSIPKDVRKKDDFTFELNNKFREFDSLKEVVEDLESLPASNKFIKAQLTNINEKLDNISVPSASKQESVKVPDEVQAVEDLATYMRDGVAQFENMSRLYVSKMSELENLDKVKEQHQAEVQKAEIVSKGQGELEAKVSLAKDIAEKFPTEFKAIKSIFDSVMAEKFNAGEIINVTNDNKNDMMPYCSTELELAEYEVVTPAVLINTEIIFKADLKKIIEPVAEIANADVEADITNEDNDSEHDTSAVAKED